MSCDIRFSITITSLPTRKEQESISIYDNKVSYYPMENGFVKMFLSKKATISAFNNIRNIVSHLIPMFAFFG